MSTKHFQPNASLVALVFCALFLFGPQLLMLQSPDFDYCRNHQGQYPGNPSDNHDQAAVPIPAGHPVETFLSCVGGYNVANAAAITAWATVLLTIVTAGLVWTAIEQSKTTRAQLRAYVLPHAIGVLDGSTFKKPIEGRAGFPWGNIDFRNTGQTPASQVLSFMGLKVIETPNEERDLQAPALQNISPFTLGVGTPFPKGCWFPRALTTAEIEGIGVVPPTHGIYIFGKVQYTDVFGSAHVTNFRFRYTGVWPPMEGSLLTFCNNGNDCT